MDLFKRIASRIMHRYFEVFGSWNRRIAGRVYMIHNVGGTEGEFNISTTQFDRLLKCLSQKNVIRLEDLDSKDDFIALSIDDVPASFYYNAFPLLKKYGIPFTLFVSCSLLDTEGYITTDMLKEMSTCGLCTVGSHGWKHDFYCKFDENAARVDLATSKTQIENIIDGLVELYAFPYGSFYACGMKQKHLVKDYYKYGFGTVACPITRPSSLPNYFLPRINLTKEIIDKICS